jgi:hypothetical protein
MRWTGAQVLVAGGFLSCLLQRHMDSYEENILFGAIPATITSWAGSQPLRVPMMVVAGLRCWASRLQDDLAPGRTGVLAQVFPVQSVGHPVDGGILHEHDFLLAACLPATRQFSVGSLTVPRWSHRFENRLGGRGHGADRHTGRWYES